jgi:hypothetical protein
MKRIDFKLDGPQDLKPEVAAFFGAPELYRPYNFFRLSSRAADEVMNRQGCQRNPKIPVLHRLDVRGGDGPKGSPAPQSVRRFYYGY